MFVYYVKDERFIKVFFIGFLWYIVQGKREKKIF